MYADTAYAPYGETYATSGAPDFSFTGMEEDVEANQNPAVLYDFPAREYGIQGRWPSPDPAGLGAVDLGNPQSWNRYAYVLNNPLARIDPTGLCDFEAEDTGDSCGGCSWWDACFGFPIDPCQFFDCGGGVGGNSAPPAQAPPAPPGGYGAGIDPYGTWDEVVPNGVQVFPSGFPHPELPGGVGGASLIPCVDGPPTPDQCEQAAQAGWEAIIGLGVAIGELARELAKRLVRVTVSCHVVDITDPNETNVLGTVKGIGVGVDYQSALNNARRVAGAAAQALHPLRRVYVRHCQAI